MINMISFNNLDKSGTKKNAFNRSETEAFSQDFNAVLSGFSPVQKSMDNSSKTDNSGEKVNESFEIFNKNESDFSQQINQKVFEVKADTPIDINPNQQSGEDKYDTPIDINPNLPGKEVKQANSPFEGRILTQFDDKVLYEKTSSGRNRPIPREPGDIRFSNSILEKTRHSGPRFVIDQENILDIPKNDLNQLSKDQTSILDLDHLPGETVEILSVKNSPAKSEVNDSKDIAEIKTDNFETHDLNKTETTDSSQVKHLKYFYNYETNRIDEVKKANLSEKSSVKNIGETVKSQILDLFVNPTEEKSQLNTQDWTAQNQAVAEQININVAEKPIPKPESPLDISNEFSGVDFEKFFKSVSNKQDVVEIAPDFLIEDSAIYEQIEPKIIELSKFVDKSEEKQLLKMRLNPAELGEIEIRLERDASGKINAHIRTENETARHILSESLGQLRDSLQNSGLNIERLEVSCDPNQLSGNAQGENGSRQNETGHDGAFGFEGNVEKEGEKREIPADRLVNLRA